MDKLQTSLVYLKGVGPNRARMLKDSLDLECFEDLIHFYPNRYIDRTHFSTIAQLTDSGADVQIIGQVRSLEWVRQPKGKRLVAHFEDDSGTLELVWFRAPAWLKDNIIKNKAYVIFGKINWFKGKASMPHPEMELLEEFKKRPTHGIQSHYPLPEKLTQKGLGQRAFNKIISQLILHESIDFRESLPEDLRKQLQLISKEDAIKEIHFPSSQIQLKHARARIKFEELFFIQLQLILKNLLHKKKIKGQLFEKVGPLFHQFYQEALPFQLTGAQKRVLKEIRKDFGTGHQMNRLLQGDVGSGKTMVAWLSILMAIDNGFQACLMAPTEILAQQHYESIAPLAATVGIEVALLTGSVKMTTRTPIYQSLEAGSLPLLIGTHALLEEKVKFQRLGLAIIDEQHRFGVAQRARLWQKNTTPPHILVMTATPIPRTLAMTLYGDLDISVIDELPPGRKSVKTVSRGDNNRLKVFQFLKEEIKKGRQVYVVYPLIQESEKMDYKDLMDGYESLSRAFPPPNYQISIVHGQMKAEAKAHEMQRFSEGKTQILLATTVIEVGVNIPNASVMVIESAERFGLSQLHQLRGRVGRGNAQSYCVLMHGSKLSEEAQNRLQTMVATNDGFEVAEADLRLRGPGNLMGTQQSGVVPLKLADLVKDQSMLIQARECATLLLKKDPELKLPQHQCLKQTLARMHPENVFWNYIS
ncbi:MAG: ATP-dependent DNA helicase RecG [Flavobacteriaceae bacterium]